MEVNGSYVQMDFALFLLIPEHGFKKKKNQTVGDHWPVHFKQPTYFLVPSKSCDVICIPGLHFCFPTDAVLLSQALAVLPVHGGSSESADRAVFVLHRSDQTPCPVPIVIQAA